MSVFSIFYLYSLYRHFHFSKLQFYISCSNLSSFDDLLLPDTIMINLSLWLSFQPAWSHHCVGEKNDFVDEDSADVDEENDDDRYWDCKM